MGIRKPSKKQILDIFNKQIDEVLKTKATRLTIDLGELIAVDPSYKPPKLFISALAKLKMLELIYEYPRTEIGWHGVVDKKISKDGSEKIFLIKDILVYPQTITSITADADEKEYGPWLMKQGALRNSIRMQGHSHVDMGVTPSGTDERYYNELLQQVDDYYIFLIVNKRKEVFTRIYDAEEDVIIEGLPLETWLGNQTMETFLKESTSTDLVKPKTYTNTYNVTPAVKNTPKDMALEDDEDYEKWAKGIRY